MAATISKVDRFLESESNEMIFVNPAFIAILLKKRNQTVRTVQQGHIAERERTACSIVLTLRKKIYLVTFRLLLIFN